MITIILLITLHLKVGEQALVNETPNGTFSCHIGDTSFWKLYNWYFGNATNIRISLLLRKHPSFVQNYVSHVMPDLFAHKMFKKSFIIQENIIVWQRNTSDTSILPSVEYIHNYDYTNISSNFNLERYREFAYVQKIRRYSGDPEDACLLIAFDVEDLTIFLKLHLWKILRNPRGSYIIHILTPDITNIETELRNVLELLWVKYGVLNVKVKLPCSVVYETTFRFNPFIYNNGAWGIVDNFDLNNAGKLNYVSNLRNMQGYPLNISMFVRRPSAMLNLPKAIKDNIYSKMVKKSGGYGGVDGIILAYISDYLNFTTQIITPPADREYGFLLNGTLVGSLGDVVYRYVEASFNGRFVSKLDSDRIEFTNPISNDYLCLLVPKSERIPQWLKISHCFELQTWLGIFGLYVAVSIYWSAANKVVIISNQSKRNVEDSFFEVLAIFISVSVRRVPFDNQRVFIAVCLIFNIIFVGTFQGSLYNSYTKESYFPDINTLEELDKHGLYIATGSQSLVTAFGTDPKPVMKRMQAKIITLNGTSSLGKAAKDRDSAAFERKADAKMRIKTEYTRASDGFELLHVMDECPWIYYVSYIVPIGSPYLHAFNYLINTFLEAGLISKWNLDTVDGLILEKRVLPNEQTETLKPFTLEDMQAAFYLASLGLLFSSFIFLFEILVYWCNKYIISRRKNKCVKMRK